MDSLRAWEKFTQSGSVLDYLAYAARSREPLCEKESGQDAERNNGDRHTPQVNG